MAKAVEQLQSGITVAHAWLGAQANGDRMSVRQACHDGDTVSVDPAGNIGVRLLGVDAPEVSFTLPNQPNTFTSIKSAGWTAFLTDPFAATLPPFVPALPPALVADLKARLGPNCAANHAAHALAATRELEKLAEADRTGAAETLETFKFFLAFAYDVIDRYGRFLGYLNHDLPSPPRPRPYNERLLIGGLVTPYFIWPNIDPFRKQPSLDKAVPRPGAPINDANLDRARKAVRDARTNHLGVFSAADPLKLLPFELRYLARTFSDPGGHGGQRVRGGPDRWVIDLAAADDRLLPPTTYTAVANLEDRLFVPSEFIPLFVDKGWKKA